MAEIKPPLRRYLCFDCGTLLFKGILTVAMIKITCKCGTVNTVGAVRKKFEVKA